MTARDDEIHAAMAASRTPNPTAPPKLHAAGRDTAERDEPSLTELGQRMFNPPSTARYGD